MQIDVDKYVTDLLLVAAAAAPWEVSEETFVSIAALLNDGTPITNGERDDIGEFLAMACDAASGDNRAADIVTLYRRAREAVKQQGCAVYEVGT